jgi:hypothetical protein
LLVHADDLAGSGAGRDGPDTLFACWCTKTDCRGLWPVAAFDADNLPGRPYLCVRVNGYVMGFGKAIAIQAEVQAAREGLAEP